jgi:hypothetical protein
MTQRTKRTTGLVRSENRAWDDLYVRGACIESIPGIKGGAPVIKGTRISSHAVEV